MAKKTAKTPAAATTPNPASAAPASNTRRKLPDVLSVQRGLFVSDGAFYNLKLNEAGELAFTNSPVRVIRHGIRGANSSPKKDDTSNIQITETAKTAFDARGLGVRFGMRAISAQELLTGCSDREYRKELKAFMSDFFCPDVEEFEEVCRRMARNVLNGRWLWRNRILGIPVIRARVGGQTLTGQGSSLVHFNDYTDDERKLAAALREGMLAPLGAGPGIEVEALIDFTFSAAVQVFPSQPMVANKPKGFARSLYKLDARSLEDMRSVMNTANKDGEGAIGFLADMIDMGIAAFRSDKISNAIKTIDTWYGESGEEMPIAVEPNGANLGDNTFYRKGEQDFREMLRDIAQVKPRQEFNPRAAFMIAMLIRGGVFSEGDKEA